MPGNDERILSNLKNSENNNTKEIIHITLKIQQQSKAKVVLIEQNNFDLYFFLSQN